MLLSYLTPWGEAVNFDQAYADQVREYFINNAIYWIKEFHIDALWLDALHAIIDSSAQPFLAELAASVHQESARLGRRVYLMAESDRNDIKFFQLVELNGLGLDCRSSGSSQYAFGTG